jgi:hypothetical protein
VMPDREPEPWESGAAAPFLWIETPQGNVEVWTLGEDRFRIAAPGFEQLVTGYEEAEKAADALAERLRLRARAELRELRSRRAGRSS